MPREPGSGPRSGRWLPWHAPATPEPEAEAPAMPELPAEATAATAEATAAAATSPLPPAIASDCAGLPGATLGRDGSARHRPARLPGRTRRRGRRARAARVGLGRRGRATRGPTGTRHAAGTRSGRAGSSCCRRSTRSSRGSAGSARPPSTTSASGSPWRPPRPTAWRRSTPCFTTSPRPPVVAHVCDDIACRLAGAEAICADLTRAVGPAGEPIRDGRATWLRSPCLGLCDRAPAVMFTAAGETPATWTAAPVDAAGIVAGLEARPPDPRTGALARARRPHRPPAAARRPAAPARPGRRRRPDLARRLPGARRLRGARARDRDRRRTRSSPRSPPRS